MLETAVSIHASRVGGDSIGQQIMDAIEVSIHASRVGGDRGLILDFQSSKSFNPRLPCGRRLQSIFEHSLKWQFQSTPPVWEATFLNAVNMAVRPVSIHASRVGGDILSVAHVDGAQCFNPRLPCGRRR